MPTPRFHTLPKGHRVLTGLALIWLGSCSQRADDCHYTLTCGDFIASGGIDAGSVGGATGSNTSTGSSNTGSSGAASGGDPSTGGSLGIGGVMPETGGVFASGGDLSTGGILATGGVATGGAPTCTPACAWDKPVCDQTNLKCVQCTSEEHCTAVIGKTHCDTNNEVCVECTKEEQCAGNINGKTHCNTDKNECVQCTGDGQCPSNAPICDAAKNVCVECLEQEDCKSPNAPACSNGQCKACSTNDDCSHIPHKGICIATVEPDAGGETNVCVECTGTDYDSCSKNDAGPARICNSRTNACTDILEGSAGLCQPCVSDAQCKDGALCVEQVFRGKSVGYFCFRRTFTDCTSSAPYITMVTAATSIDGTVANICSLRKSTCVALNQFFDQTECNTNNAPDDSRCGADPGVDAKCVAWGSAKYRCTIACASGDDCPTSCNTTTTAPYFCNL